MTVRAEKSERYGQPGIAIDRTDVTELLDGNQLKRLARESENRYTLQEEHHRSQRDKETAVQEAERRRRKFGPLAIALLRCRRNRHGTVRRGRSLKKK